MPQSFANDLHKAITRAINQLNDALPEVGVEVMREIESLLSELNVQDGKIKATALNLNVVAKIKGKIERIIADNSLYSINIAEYISSFSTIDDLQKRYFNSLFNDFKPSAATREMRDIAVRNTLSMLGRAGISVNIVDPILSILRQNVTSGAGFFDLAKQLRLYIVGDKSNIGHLEKYVKQITTDALNQYSAEYMNLVSNDLNLEWFNYTSGIVADSRDFCIALKRKKYYHRREVPDLIKGRFKEFKEIGGTIYAKTKLPNGMIPGTNAETFPIYRGGYNCPHQPIPVPESSVPKNTRKSVYVKYNIPHDVNGFASR